MDKNLNLADYWTKSPPLIFALILIAVTLVGVLLSNQSDHTKPQVIIGTSLGSEERTRDGEKVKFLLVELDSGSEILVALPARKEAEIGAKVKVTKRKSSYPGSSSYNYTFEKYAN